MRHVICPSMESKLSDLIISLVESNYPRPAVGGLAPLEPRTERYEWAPSTQTNLNESHHPHLQRNESATERVFVEREANLRI